MGFAFWKCSTPIAGKPVPLIAERCPSLGSRTQELFGVALATVLSLLGSGGAGAAEDSKPAKEPDAERKEK